jgi:hypothetical protein
VPLPEPRLGLVVHYSFLWSHERARGASEGRKDRPCAIVVARRSAEGGSVLVPLLPITHRAPGSEGESHLGLTRRECEAIGLDAGEHWVVLDEMNEFVWPGHDLRPIPGTDRFDHGMLPEATFRRIVRAVLALDARRKAEGRRPPLAIDRDA